MEFRKYSSIENSFQKDFVAQVQESEFSMYEYVVQEKVHGANLSFITDGQTIQVAKRTDYIFENEIFYNYEIVLEKYRSKIIDLFQNIAEIFPNVTQVTVFGELYGGTYPHANVPKNKNSTNIQKGIFYSPDNDFYAFDILVNNHIYLEVDVMNQLFEKNGFFYAKTLFKGSLDECLKYPNSFQSNISTWLGLPEMPDNVCEGVVIRPTIPCFLNNGSRVMIKNKNEKWAEKSHQSNRRPKSEQPEEKLSDEALRLCDESLKFINRNRFENVISKIGEVSIKDFGKLVGLFSKDIIDDFMKEFSTVYDQLEKNESKALNKFINKNAETVIRNYFKNN